MHDSIIICGFKILFNLHHLIHEWINVWYWICKSWIKLSLGLHQYKTLACPQSSQGQPRKYPTGLFYSQACFTNSLVTNQITYFYWQMGEKNGSGQRPTFQILNGSSTKKYCISSQKSWNFRIKTTFRINIANIV